MSSVQVWRLRYPDGSVEYRTAPDPLEEGAVIHGRGQTWIVDATQGETATVRPMPSDGLPARDAG